jgi:hypothetical protein
VKITDGNSGGNLNCNSAMLGKVFSHLLNAKRAVGSKHAANAHINKAVNQLNGIVDDSADASDSQNVDANSPGSIDRNVNARGQGAPQATGASDIADKGAIARRDILVKALYRKAAFEKDKDRKAVIEKMAMALDSLDFRDVNAMNEADWSAYRNGDEAAIKKAERRTGGRFTELFKAGAKPSNDRSTFAGRHGG